MWDEVKESDDFIEPGLADELILPLRRVLVLGYAGARINSLALRGRDVTHDSETLVSNLHKHIPMLPWGEAAWNFWINLVLAMRHTQIGVLTGEHLIERWIATVAPQASRDVLRDPYWTAEDALESFLDSPSTQDPIRPARLSYTLTAAVSYFARRGWRRPIERSWATISRTDRAELIPAQEFDLLSWRTEGSWLHVRVPPIEDSWARIREESFGFRTGMFDDAPWLLPYVMCTFPHRTNPALSGELDARTGSSNPLST
jgi:hypothetical protein